MSISNIIGNMLRQRLSGQSNQRRRAANHHRDASNGGIEQLLSSFLGGSGKSGGLEPTKAGGLGAIAGMFLGGGVGGAAKGGAMAVLGTLALKAWRDHQAQSSGAQVDADPSPEEVEALTGPATERLVLQAMIGAAQVDGHVDEAEMKKILGHMNDDDVTEAERQALQADLQRPVDLNALASQITRPEVATEVYLAALMAVDIDTDAERDYLRRLSEVLRLDKDVLSRLHRMTGNTDMTTSTM